MLSGIVFFEGYLGWERGRSESEGGVGGLPVLECLVRRGPFPPPGAARKKSAGRRRILLIVVNWVNRAQERSSCAVSDDGGADGGSFDPSIQVLCEIWEKTVAKSSFDREHKIIVESLRPFLPLGLYLLGLIALAAIGGIVLARRVRRAEALPAKREAMGRGRVMPVLIWGLGGAVMVAIGMLMDRALLPVVVFLGGGAHVNGIYAAFRWRLRRSLAPPQADDPNETQPQWS